MSGEIDFGGLRLLLVVIGYGMAVEQHTGRQSVENLVAALRRSRNRKRDIDGLNVRLRRCADTIRRRNREIEKLCGKLFALRISSLTTGGGNDREQ